jgi:hypothetical protein
MNIVRTQQTPALERKVFRERCLAFQRVYWKWHASKADKRILPRPIDLILSPELREDLAQPHYVSMAESTFESFRDRLDDSSTQWRKRCDDRLRDIARNTPEFQGKISQDTDPLTLASVVFTCSSCKYGWDSNESIEPFYPSVISHNCLWLRVVTAQDPLTRAACECSFAYTGSFDYGEWDCCRLNLGLWHQRAAELIRLSGKDPVTTTQQEMDALDMRFCCKTCVQELDGYKEVMGWRGTVSGAYANHIG